MEKRRKARRKGFFRTTFLLNQKWLGKSEPAKRRLWSCSFQPPTLGTFESLISAVIVQTF